jgi:hypothetical protein
LSVLGSESHTSTLADTSCRSVVVSIRISPNTLKVIVAVHVDEVDVGATGMDAPADEDMPFMGTTTSSWSDTKTSFKYSKLILMFFH